MTIYPLHDYIIVRPITESQSMSGFLIPESATKKLIRGKALTVEKGKILKSGNKVSVVMKTWTLGAV